MESVDATPPKKTVNKTNCCACFRKSFQFYIFFMIKKLQKAVLLLINSCSYFVLGDWKFLKTSVVINTKRDFHRSDVDLFWRTKYSNYSIFILSQGCFIWLSIGNLCEKIPDSWKEFLSVLGRWKNMLYVNSFLKKHRTESFKEKHIGLEPIQLENIFFTTDICTDIIYTWDHKIDLLSFEYFVHLVWHLVQSLSDHKKAFQQDAYRPLGNHPSFSYSGHHQMSLLAS